jgi:hypothetical protein
MASLDELFPNRVDCYLALFQDAVYEHDNQLNYSYDQGAFKGEIERPSCKQRPAWPILYTLI